MKKRHLILLIIVFVFALVLIGIGGYLVYKNINILNSKNEYDNLASSYASGIDNTIPVEPATDEAGVPIVENPIDFDSLAQKNSDIYSWLIIPDTNVNYPVLQSNVNDNFYLDHGIDKKHCRDLLLSDIEAVALQLVDQIAENVDIIGCDHIGAVGDLLDLAFHGIGNATQEVDEASCNLLIGLLEVDDNGPALAEVICDLGSIVVSLGLYQHDRKLSCGIDIDYLIICAASEIGC